VPIAENLPEPLLKSPDSDIIRNKPIIATEKPGNQDNLLLTDKTKKNPTITDYQPQSLISEISLKTPEKFPLNTNEQLPLITNREQPTSQEQFLLTRIKQLENQLKQVKTENEKLKTENKLLKALIKQDQETETKVIQSLPFKGKE
jgi:hypothetical protein